MRNDQLKNEAIYNQERQEQYVWGQSRTHGISRRRVLQLLAAGVLVGRHAWTQTGGSQNSPDAPCVVGPTDLLIPRGGANYEMPFGAIPHHEYFVPNDLFFIRSHDCTPQLDAATWTLQIGGDGVDNPTQLTYADILNMEPVTVRRFVECAGNGRGFFDIQEHQKAIGGQWLLGAIGVAKWTGVRLRQVLERAGLKDSAVDVMPIGLDSLQVRRPMPIEKALEEDTLLVYAMNDEPLPQDHGFPVRVLVPGWVGVASTKWVGQIQVSQTPLFSPFGSTVPPFTTQSYRLFGDAYPTDGVLLTRQNVKSAFELAFPAQLPAGKQTLHGRSWSGNGKIDHVQVSFDGGEWQRAHFASENIPTAWVRWIIKWDAQPGQHILRARAVDETGEGQPDTVPFNKLGYLFNAIVDHPVSVQ